MAKPKPKGWSAMSKTQQEKWKKDNFSSSVKVTAADLAKLRAEKTPEKAIAKYKNDPAMREALNRFYGKARVGSVTGTGSGSSSTTKPGGPGAKMPKPPMGGPGSKTGRDGRVSASEKTVTMGSRTGGTITVSKAANDKRKAEFQKRTGTAIAVGATAIPAAKGAMMVGKAASKVAPKALPKAKAMVSKVKSMGTKTPKVAETPKVAPKTASKFKQSPKAAPKAAPKPAPKRSLPPKKGSQ